MKYLLTRQAGALIAGIGIITNVNGNTDDTQAMALLGAAVMGIGLMLMTFDS